MPMRNSMRWWFWRFSTAPGRILKRAIAQAKSLLRPVPETLSRRVYLNLILLLKLGEAIALRMS